MSGADPTSFDNTVHFDAVAAVKAATGLDGLADRLQADVRAARAPLAVGPAGADEVSVRAANTMTEVGTSYLDRAEAGIHELRKLAAMLRMQTSQFARMESDNAADFTKL